MIIPKQLLVLLVVFATGSKSLAKPNRLNMLKEASQSKEEIINEALRGEAKSLVKELQNSWTNTDPKIFPKLTLTPKQQAWFNGLGNRQDVHNAPPRAVRKEIRQLSPEEFLAFSEAVNKLHTSFPDPEVALSEYGLFVQMHRPEMAPAAHLGAAFLPWHREYLWRMEQALRAHDPQVSLPYWDNTLDQPLPQPRDSILWSHQLLGNVVGQVRSGPFANWSIIPECHDFPSELLRRNSWPNILGLMNLLHYDDADLQSFWNLTEFRQLIWPVFPDFEDDHGHGHFIINGHMSHVTCSPSDPAFWMHHGFIDFIWEEFRQNSQTTDRELEYPTNDDNNIGGEEHEAYSYMEPFRPLYNIHGLSNHYTNYYYRYQPRSIQCNVEEDCGSPYLWCNQANQRCTSKIRLGGRCNDLPDSSCYGEEAKCIENSCT